MNSFQKKPSSIASLFIVFLIIHKGSSQDPCALSNTVGLAVIGSVTVSVDGSLSAATVPICIRCGYFPGTTVLVTDPDNVTYVANGLDIENTTDTIITNKGLLLPDPASSFPGGETIRCNYNDGIMSGSRAINIEIFIFNPPPITPTGDILDYIEGDTVTLTCTGDSQIDNDEYQWTLPDGSKNPINNPIDADDGLDLTLTNVSRTQSGVYICIGEIIGRDGTVESNVTLNIQYPVKITSFTPDNSTVTVGSMLTLNCTFDGNPSPSVLWSHNGSILDVQNDPNLTETITDTYGLLNIVYNGGIAVYGCIVNNTISSDETTITMYPASSSTTVMPSSTTSTGQLTIPSPTTAPSTTATSTTTITTTTATTTTTTTPTNAYQAETVAYIVPIVVCLVAVFIVVSIVLCIFLLHKHFSKKRTIITHDKTTNEYFANPSNSQDMNNSAPLVTNAGNPVYATVIKKKTSIVVVNEECTETPPPEIIPFDDTLHDLTNDDTLLVLTNDDTLPDLSSHDANNEQSLVEVNKKKLENVFEESGNVSKKKSSNGIIYAELDILKKRNTNPPSLPSSTATNTTAQNNIIYSTLQGIEQPPPVPVTASALCPHSSVQNVFEGSGTVSEKKSSNEIIYAELDILKRRNTNPPSPPSSTATNTTAQNNIIYSTIVGIEQPPPVPKRTFSTKQMRQQRLHSELRELTYSAEGKPPDQDGDDTMTSSMVTKLL